MKLNIEQEMKTALAVFKNGKSQEAERLYRKILKKQPNYLYANHNLGLLLQALGRFDEAEVSYKKAIELKPDYAEVYNNLGVILVKLRRLDEAKEAYKKAIELKPNYVSAHSNLGVLHQTLGRFDNAEAAYKKAIELEPNYADAHYNLGNLLYDFHKFDQAIDMYKKVLEIKPDYIMAYCNLANTLKKINKFDQAIDIYKKALEVKPDHIMVRDNLDITLRQKKLVLKLLETRNSKHKTKISLKKKFCAKLFGSDLRLTNNPFISNREVEIELLTDLYKINTLELDKTKDARFGDGRCSDFHLFENNSLIIKRVAKDLTNIMKQAVKSEIFIYDSFFNILKAGGGSNPHQHLNDFDAVRGLINQKYSLTYYLSVGDQNCSEPGNLKIYEPDKEILLSKGKIVILPASRKHSAVYGGKTDRVMIGVNFYSLT